jgi:hypothetical protein
VFEITYVVFLQQTNRCNNFVWPISTIMSWIITSFNAGTTVMSGVMVKLYFPAGRPLTNFPSTFTFVE